MKVALGSLGTIVLIVLIVVAVDLASTPPTPARGTCVFQDRILLPDICVSGCAGCPTCPTASTRPYFIFWTEAAGCPGFCICGPSGSADPARRVTLFSACPS